MLRDFVQAIEWLGADSFWAPDHPVVFPECWTALGALAAVTDRIRLGPLVGCVYYRSPVVLARVAADVDGLSAGRLVLGLGIGDNRTEFERMGLSFAPARERQATLEETIQVVSGLWEQDPFSFSGQHIQVNHVSGQARPIQRPRVPLLIAGGGERVTLRQVARYADMSNFGAHEAVGGAFSLADVQRKCAVLREHCAALGRPYDSVLRSHWACPVVVAETPGAVRAKLAALPGWLREGFAKSRIVGTPAEVVAQYRPLVEAGMRYLIATVVGADLETVRLLAEQVIPEVDSTS